MRVAEILEWGAEKLYEAGIEESELDARLLLEHVLGKSRTELFLMATSSVDQDLFHCYKRLIDRRAKREPVAYITGMQEFWSLPFVVTPDVLIPRPETEFLLEQVFKRVQSDNVESGSMVDLCCGSGVIATVLARETGQRVVAIDLSRKAIDVAKQNSHRHGVGSRVHLIQGDLLTPLSTERKLSLVVSNPPYVSHLDVMENLEPEVSEYEPHLALDGGQEGLDLIVRIREQLEDRLCAGGEIFMEIGADQGSAVHEIFSSRTPGSGFGRVDILIDYAGRDRVLHAVKS